jgi:hypothetical protein
MSSRRVRLILPISNAGAAAPACGAGPLAQCVSNSASVPSNIQMLAVAISSVLLK